jgi:hypothetical protein
MMADLHMEGLGTNDVARLVDQGLASLNARLTDSDELSEVPGTVKQGLARAITEACGAWDGFADLLPGFRACEGCEHTDFPGIRWPASPDGCDDLSYVEKCDECATYESDEAAAEHLAQHFGVRWGYARRAAYPPKTEADIRWRPPKNDGLDYTGWSAFIDRPERDG